MNVDSPARGAGEMPKFAAGARSESRPQRVAPAASPLHRCRYATPQKRMAATASAWAQPTSPSTGTYSSMVWAIVAPSGSKPGGPQPTEGTPATGVKVAPSYQESRPPSSRRRPTSALASSIVATTGSDGSISIGMTPLVPQSNWGGCSASQSSRSAHRRTIQSCTSWRTFDPQPVASAWAGTYMTASGSSQDDG